MIVVTRDLKKLIFFHSGHHQRSTRVFVARDGSLWYRSMNGWARTYATSDYIYFRPTRAHSSLYSHLKASNPEDMAEYERIAQEKLEELANNDNRGY